LLSTANHPGESCDTRTFRPRDTRRPPGAAAPGRNRRLATLTDRELEGLRLVAQALTDAEIAAPLFGARER
jgi:DNA-binding CsgD family transcriptional regulator